MAAVLVTTIKRFLGTAAEMAALNVAKVPAGSTFFQTDTGLLYNLDSAGFWAVKKTQLAALPAGTAVIGKVSIDQTTPGTTNKVVAELSGSNAPLSGQKSVTVAGIPEALGGDQGYKKITIIANTGNTGYIYVGKDTVDSSTGVILPAGGFVELDFVNTIAVYVDASVSGEGVSWIGVI